MVQIMLNAYFDDKRVYPESVTYTAARWVPTFPIDSPVVNPQGMRVH